ncbi:hypothetical protein DDT91_06325 [Algoriphagus sp. AK58]|nr:hypothetical protein [Algoriphagus sp. AK58]
MIKKRGFSSRNISIKATSKVDKPSYQWIFSLMKFLFKPDFNHPFFIYNSSISVLWLEKISFQ